MMVQSWCWGCDDNNNNKVYEWMNEWMYQWKEKYDNDDRMIIRTYW